VSVVQHTPVLVNDLRAWIDQLLAIAVKPNKQTKKKVRLMRLAMTAESAALDDDIAGVATHASEEVRDPVGTGAEPNLALRRSPITFLAPLRRSPNRIARHRARYFRGPTWSRAQWAMAFVGRVVALAPDDQHRPDALRAGARVLAALVRDHEVLKPDAIDRVQNAGVAFGINDATIQEILRSEFAS
jgi:hypothetical protein